MNPEPQTTTTPMPTSARPGKRRGVVLIAVLLIVVILALAGYQYGDLMFSEYKSSENAHRNVQARLFAESGIHYTAALLANNDNYVNMLGSNPWNNPQMFKDRKIESDGKVVQEWKPRQVRRVLSSKTSAEVCMMLREVVSNGTGKVAAIPGYQVGGKTGTARKYHANQYVGSFIGVVPASPNVQPRAVILVAVDEPQGAHYGADVAAPSFQSIASRLLTDWHVAEDDPNQTQAKIAAAKRKHLASAH